MPRTLPALLLAALALGCGESETRSTVAAEPSIAEWRWAPRDEVPARKAPAERPRAADRDPEPDPAPPEPASSPPEPEPEPVPEPDPLPDTGGSTSTDDALVKAEVLENGVALPPLESPPQVQAIFEAGNTIARSPYKWGGGHGKWQDNGYDCSGSVSYALAAAGLLEGPMASGPFMRWGKPGKGRWVTIYTNPGHMFMVVAGVRFDTVARGQTGSRWINDATSTKGYVARHPPGL